MSMYRPHFSIKVLLVALIGSLSLHCAFADPPSVTAVLSNSEAAVGQMVQLEVRVKGANEARIPDISVDGLEIHPTGTSRQVEMRNLTVSSSVTYSYTVLPLKAGTFRIPPQTIRAGASSLQTPELELHVIDVAGGRNPIARSTPSSRSNPGAVDTSKLVFAELIVPKKTAYVGEMIPVVVRLGFANRVLGLDGPEIIGQGFTMQKLQGSEQPQLESINGRQWEVYTFKTAVAATRPGKFEIGPVKATAKMVVANRPRSSRSRSPFDIFNMDDPFSDPFFADPFGRVGERRDVPIVSEAAPLEVKPLPPGAPANFSGAVGNFTMTVDANPKKVQVGDPITVTSTIAGRGNFDRVNGPALEEERGWHKYPPSSKFKQDDDVGISGTKTFEMVLSPNERKQSISPFVFSYFDPAKETYVSLRNDAIAIRVEGGAAAPAASATPTSAVTATSSPATTPTSKPQDILYQLTERPARAQSFTPLYARRIFWLAQIVPFLVLLGFIGWKIRQSRLDDREAQRIAALHNEAAELVRKLRRDDASPQTYFSQAARAVQVKTALARNVDPNMVDAETAAATFQLDESLRDQLRRLFERSDELRYSGARNGAETISAENRREVLDLVESLRT
ncbi:MAG: BatD family protein [Verrucomicrobiota bacterium]|nr:BatD family protein [Verrucomicrobiota bacterium]